MSQYDPKKIEELQLVLLKDPRSPVFGSLAEAYRKMGLLEEALEVTAKGVRHNPDYVSGLVAHGKILFELKDFRECLKFLRKATALKPENILALKIMGHCFLKLRKHHEALRAFKKLLIVKPDDPHALQAVKKWEFLDNLPPDSGKEKINIEGYDHWVRSLPSESHAVHLIDSFMNYGDKENALDIATAAAIEWPESNAIKKRKEILLKPSTDEIQTDSELEDNPALDYLRLKKEFYQQWLQRIEQRKRIDP